MNTTFGLVGRMGAGISNNVGTAEEHFLVKRKSLKMISDNGKKWWWGEGGGGDKCSRQTKATKGSVWLAKNARIPVVRPL